jgi:biopolymer transport protein ExbD
MRTAINAGKGLWVLLGLMTCLLPACSARDSHHFRSTVDRPMTVNLRDPFTKQLLWTKPIPVNHVLVLDLQHPNDVPFMHADELPATHFTWAIYPGTKFYGAFPLEFGVSAVDEGESDLPGSPVQIFAELRPGPEYPADYIPPMPAGVKTPMVPTTAPTPGSSGSIPTTNPGAIPQTNPAIPTTNPGAVTRVILGGDGAVSVGGRKLDDAQLGEFLKALAKEDPTRAVKVTSDKDVPIAMLNALIARIKDAGLANVTMDNP